MAQEEPEITTVSTKGQIVIPQPLRAKLNIRPKTKLLVYGEGDTLILKKLGLPDLRREWAELFRAIGRKKLRVTEEEVAREVQAVRRQRRMSKR